VRIGLYLGHALKKKNWLRKTFGLKGVEDSEKFSVFYNKELRDLFWSPTRPIVKGTEIKSDEMGWTYNSEWGDKKCT
jgi:hypothetical protein